MSVTARSTEPIASGRFAAVQRSISRNEFFAGLYILACANGLLGRAIQSITFESWMGALSGVDINVIVVLACFAGISVMLSSDHREDLRPLDFMVAIPFLALVMLPIFSISWLA